MSQKLPDRRIFDAIIKGINDILPFINLPPKVKAAIVAGLIFLAAVVTAVYTTDTADPPAPPLVGSAMYLKEGETVTNDVEILIPQGNLKAETEADVQGVTVVEQIHDYSPLAPPMDWNILDLREGKEHLFCFQGLTPKNEAAVTEILDFLAQQMPVVEREDGSRVGFSWRRASVTECPSAPYRATETAHLICGPDAVACAAGYNDGRTRGGTIAINPRFNSMPDVRGSWLHEALHLLANRGHNDCGIVRNKAGQPVPSVMTPVNIATGWSCSDPPAKGPVADDLETVFDEIGYPKNLPTPDEPVARAAQLWIEANRTSCPAPNTLDPSGQWCLSPILPIGKDGVFVALIQFPESGIAQHVKFQLVEE